MCMKLRSTAAKHKERQNTLQAQRLERLNALSVRSKVESKTGLRLYDGYDLVLSINVMVGFWWFGCCQPLYNQAPNLTQDTNGKVTTSQLDITHESQEVSHFAADDHKASTTDVHESLTKEDRNNINDPQKQHCLRPVSKNILLEGLNRFNGAPTSPLVQIWIKTHR